jgi:S-DNA-T family DNA segregation ATPase FtsK/SpoIIIE
MSLHGAEAAPQRLLPETMDERLRRWLNKVLGLCLLALAAVGWLALVTWSGRDGVLLAAGERPFNLVGISGAKVADSLLQMLGLAAALVMLPIAEAARRLLTDRSFAGWRHRALWAALSLALVTVGLSAIPTPGSWPLPYGLGGLLGDSLVIVSAPLAVVLGADSAMQALTVLGLVLGALGTLRSLDVDLRLLVGLTAERVPVAVPDPDALARANWRTRASMPTLGAALPEARLEAGSPHASATAGQPTGAPSLPTAGPALRQPATVPASRSPKPAGDFGSQLDHAPDLRPEPRPLPHAASSPPVQQSRHGSRYGHAAPPLPHESPRPFDAARSPDLRTAPPTFPPSARSGGHPASPMPMPVPAHPTPDAGVHGGASGRTGRASLEEERTLDPAAKSLAERFAPRSVSRDRGAAEVANGAKSEPSDGEAGGGVMRRTHQWLAGWRPRAGAGNREAAVQRPRYVAPGIDLLRRAGVGVRNPEFSEAALAETGRQLVSVLAEFGVAGRIARIEPGPVVTRFELLPEEGVKPARVMGLADDLARALSVPALRVAGAVERGGLVLELPNVRRETIGARDLIDAEPFRSGGGTLPLALGKNTAGVPVVVDLARLPNLLVAGAPGAGVASVLDAAILSLLYKLGPDDCRLLLIAGNAAHARSLAAWEAAPHALAPVLATPAPARAALAWLVHEMEERARRLSSMQVRSIDAYNHRARAARERGEPLARRMATGFDANGAPIYETETRDPIPIPRIVPVVLDPSALFSGEPEAARAFEHCLGRTARATGVHVVVGVEATSFADGDAMVAALLRQMPARAVLAVGGKRDGRAVIGEAGAEHLLGHGDMLLATGTMPIERVHAPLVEREEIAAVVASLAGQRATGPEPGLASALAVTTLAGERIRAAASPLPGSRSH